MRVFEVRVYKHFPPDKEGNRVIAPAGGNLPTYSLHPVPLEEREKHIKEGNMLVRARKEGQFSAWLIIPLNNGIVHPAFLSQTVIADIITLHDGGTSPYYDVGKPFSDN